MSARHVARRVVGGVLVLSLTASAWVIAYLVFREPPGSYGDAVLALVPMALTPVCVALAVVLWLLRDRQ